MIKGRNKGPEVVKCGGQNLNFGCLISSASGESSKRLTTPGPFVSQLALILQVGAVREAC